MTERLRSTQFKVKHPEFGDVIFTGITLRQRNVLEEYRRLVKNRGLRKKVTVKTK